MGGSYYPVPCSILSIGKERKTLQRYLDVPTTSWRISIRSMDSFQGLTPKSPSSWHRSLAPKDLALYDNESWNDPRDFGKPVKAITLPQDVPMVPTTLSVSWKTQNKPLLNTHPHVPMKQELSGIPLSPRKTILVTPTIRHGEVTRTLEGLVSEFMASQDARLSKFEADFKQQQSEMTNKMDTVLKAITNRIEGTLPSDTVKNPKLGNHPVSSTRSYPTMDPQCSTQIHGSLNTITIYPKQYKESQVNGPKVDLEEDNSGDTNPFASITTKQVQKLKSMLESLELVPQSSNTKFYCSKEDDGEVIFIDIIRDDEP
ncbi:hypothetical protein Tco_1242254 [Tanacetum coccineum]